MFGSKKKVDVRLTKEQLDDVLKRMTPRERKKFRKDQKEMEKGQLDDAFMMGMLLDDDDEW